MTPALTQGMVDVDGIAVHHTWGGGGPGGRGGGGGARGRHRDVLLIHGLGSSGYIEWRRTLPALVRNHRVRAPDLPGFGRSAKPSARYGVDYFVRILAHYLDRCGVDRTAVVGASLGGRVAIELALRLGDRATKLVLVDSLGLGRPQMQFLYAVLVVPGVGEAAMRLAGMALDRAPAALIRRFSARYTGAAADMTTVLEEATLADLREMYRQDGYSAAYLATVRSLMRPQDLAGTVDLVEPLRRLGLPVLLLWGARDPLFPVAHATRAHARLPGARLTIIEGAGHTPQAERPDEFNRALASFLD